jgi:Uma2 family endonuclease
MATTLVSVEEYLKTSFPDQDYEYVDGQLVELPMPLFDHGDIIVNITTHLRNNYSDFLWSVTGVRMRTTPTRYRIPDVCAGLGPKTHGVITEPPFIVVEIVSPDERASELDKKVHEYLSLGIPNIWVCYPETHRVVSHQPGAALEIGDVLHTSNPEIELPLSVIFHL